jgi:hypothetical protein
VKRIIVGIIILVLYGAVTYTRVPVFHDNLSLWTATVKVSPCLARPRANLSMALHDAGRESEAEHHWGILARIVADHTCDPSF